MHKILRMFLLIFSVVLIIVASVAAFIEPAGAWPIAAIAIFVLLLSNIDRFSEISASTSGMKATLKDARNTISELRDLVETNSELQLTLIQRAGRIGSFDVEIAESYFDRITKLMTDSGIKQSKINKIKEKCWYIYIEHDYANSILGNSTIPTNATLAEVESWKKFVEFGTTTKPELIEEYIKETADNNQDRLHFLECYRYYLKNRTHKDLKAWREKYKIPPILFRSERPETI